MRYFNFNNSTKNAISRLSFAFSIIACILFAGTAWGQAKVTVGSDISATGSMVLEVSGVDNASVSATPVERTSPNGKQLYCAYDIDITKDGREWQPEPEQPAMVSMEGTNFADGQMLDIYHEGANGLEFVATVASENGKITFPAHSFSVYIVAEAGDYARLKVNLHRADGSVVTIWVKKLDLDTYQGAGNFNRIVYNPGMGTPADGVDCMGWIADESYDEESISEALTFDDIRNKIISLLNEGVEDGDELDFYAMLFKNYSVTYLAENGSVLHTDVMPFRADADSPTLNYSVNASYTPAFSYQNHEGWLVATRPDGAHIVGHNDDSFNYTNSTEIDITGDVTFRVNVSSGHWLIYKENGKGATYKAADFVRAGEVTVDPQPALEMRRNGYTFDHWWTGEPTIPEGTPTGPQFVFGGELDQDTIVYAKWNALETAGYSVIIWKQNVSGTGYDFAEIITDLPEGRVGTAISTVTAPNGTGATDSYANIDNTPKQYTGFHLDSLDENVLVKTEGNAVLNIYYGRNEYTLHFQAQTTVYTYTSTTSSSGTQYGLVNGVYVKLTKRGKNWYYNGNTHYTGIRYSRSSSYDWHDIKTITALYQQYIGDNFPIVGTNGVTYNNGERWDPQSNTPYSQVLVYIDIMPNADVTFRLNTSSNSTKHIHYYVETIPGQTPTRTYNGRGFTEYKTVDANYGFFTEAEDYINLVGFSKNNSYPPQAYKANNTTSVNQVWNNGEAIHVYCYYLRNYYSIIFMNGAYFDGNNNNLRTDGSTPIETVSGIAYGANVRSYNDYTPSPSLVPDGYVFEGWYADKTCTRPFDFTTMPSANVTVYAKWRQIQYRVFLHPNVDAEDISLNWGDEGQEMNFRITCGDKVSTPTGLRADYEFVGWYTDEQFRHAFNADATPLNETTVTTPYDKTTDYTGPMDKYGNIGDNPWNSDSMQNATTVRDPKRFWITKKFDLYGKWRAILRGAIGINVEYDAGEGFGAPTDSKLYQDHAYAVAGHASSHTTKEFSHWVLQQWNSLAGRYDDTPTNIYPGATLLVLKDNARMYDAAWLNQDSVAYTGDSFDITGETAPNSEYTIFRATYTLKLRAEYIEREEPTHTYVQWFKNDGTDEVYIDGESTTSPTLGINVAVEPQVPTRTGYNFKGWYRSEDGTGALVTNCEPNFLHYNNGAFAEGSLVAADNYSPRQYLYAIWEPIVDFTLPPVCQGAPVELPLKTKYYVDLSADGWSWTASSGTVDGRIFTPSEGESVTLTFNPASSTCAPSTSFPMALKTPNVPNASSYDFIWRGGTASHLTDWNTESNWFVYNGNYSIATAMPTSNSKVFIGPADCITSNWPSQTAEASAKDITIASGASLTVPTGKTLKIYGNLDNIGTLSSATDGTVEFCGTSANQTISHDITLGNVVFYNQGGDIVPSGNVTINGAATFKDGVVKHDVTFGADASVAGEDAMTYNSYVDGKVTKTGSANGFTFPTGQNSVLGKIKATSDAENVSVQYFHNPAGFTESEMPRWWNINDMCSNNNPQLDHVSNVEYWDVATTLGIEAVLTVSAANGTAHFNTNTVTYDADDIYGAFWSGSCWENIGGRSQSVSGVPADPHGTISVAVKIPQTRTVYDKIVTLGSKDHNTVLPIELTSFSATCDGRSSYVKWTTATEKNNDYFSLERSDDAINFVEIARIAGAGNSIEPLIYSYTDYGVYGGDNYYRLVQVDYDGTRTASEIIVTNCVETSEEEPEVIAYPNPFNSDLTVELENFGDRPASIEVYDVLGRLVYVEKADAPQNSYQTILHLGNLSKSTYTVRVSTADFVINRKVVKD